MLQSPGVLQCVAVCCSVLQCVAVCGYIDAGKYSKCEVNAYVQLVANMNESCHV